MKDHNDPIIIFDFLYFSPKLLKVYRKILEKTTVVAYLSGEGSN